MLHSLAVMRRLAAADSLWALLFYVLLTSAYFFPVVTHISSSIPGDSFILSHYGNCIFYRFDPAQGFQIPSFTDMQRYPQGGFLVFNSWANIIFIAVMRNMLPLPAAFNLALLLSFLLAPFAMYLLAKDLFQNRGTALIAGVVYGFHPIVQSAVHNGMIEQFHHGWLPLYLLFLLRLVRGRTSAISYFGLGGSFLMAFTNFPYYAAYALIFTGVILGAHLWSVRKELRPHMRNMALIILILAAISVYPLKYYRSLINIPSENLVLCPVDVATRNLAMTPEKIPHVDIAEFFSPWRISEFRFISYLGVIFIPILGFSLFGARRKGTLLWLVTFGIFLSLSVGPVLVCGGKTVTIGGYPVITPYLILQKIMPTYFTGILTYRFLYGAVLSLALLVACELSFALKCLPRSWRTIVTALFLLVSLNSLLLPSVFSYPVKAYTLETPSFYRQMAADKDEYAILEFPDLPADVDSGLFTTQYFSQLMSCYQVTHMKKMGNSFTLFPNSKVRSNPFIADCLNIARSGKTKCMATSGDIECLCAIGFRYLIVHRSLLPPNILPALLDYMEKKLGSPVYQDVQGDIVVFSFVKGCGCEGAHCH